MMTMAKTIVAAVLLFLAMPAHAEDLRAGKNYIPTRVYSEAEDNAVLEGFENGIILGFGVDLGRNVVLASPEIFGMRRHCQEDQHSSHNCFRHRHHRINSLQPHKAARNSGREPAVAGARQRPRPC